MVNRIRSVGWHLIAVVLVPLALATSAQATQFLMSGHIDMRPAGVGPTRAFDATGIVTTNNGVLNVPANRFATTGSTLRLFAAYPVVAQLFSTFTSTEAATTFKAGGGPGSFKFCPEDPAHGGPNPVTECANLGEGLNQTVMTANGGTSTVGTYNAVPANGGPEGGVGAKLIYTAGTATFGGTFKINRVLQGSIAFCNNTMPGAICSNQLRGGTRLWTPGGSCNASGCQSGGHRETVNVPQGVVIISPMFGPNGSITDMASTQMTGGLGPAIPDSFGIGFPLTTGSMRMDDNVGTTGEVPPTLTRHFTVAGYDNRVLGVGNIKLVGAAYAWGGTTGATYPRTTSLYMTTSTLAAVSGPGILVALGILGGGYALRRRMIAKR